MRRFLLPLVIFTVLMVVQAGATLIMSPIGTVYAFPPDNVSGQGPVTFGPGITWSSTTDCTMVSCSLFGYTGSYPFGLNGNWTGALGPMAGLNDSTDFFGVTDTMTFAFATPVSAVGGLLNYYLGVVPSSNPTTIAVYDSSCDPRVSVCTPIESYDLTFATNGNDDTGAFYGFQESTASIMYFTLTDNYIGITQLTVESPVPEPGSILLMGSGLLGLIGYGRRRLGL